MLFQPDIAPVGGSLLWSALLAMLPLIAVFITLGALNWKAHWACLFGVGVSLVVAVAFFKMPAGMAIASATEGAAFGLFPITWIVLTAIFLFELTVAFGHHNDLMQAFNAISTDPRVLRVVEEVGQMSAYPVLRLPVGVCRLISRFFPVIKGEKPRGGEKRVETSVLEVIPDGDVQGTTLPAKAVEDVFCHTQHVFGTLAVGLGSFPLDYETSLPQSHS